MLEQSFPKLLALLALAAVVPVYAQYPSSNPPGPLPEAAMAAPSAGAEPLRSLELSTGAQHLSNGYGDWRDVTLRGSYASGAHVWHGELSAKRQFGQNGRFVGLSDTITISPDWFAMLSVGAGDGAFFLPQFRTDAFLYRKWLPERNLVTAIGAGYYHAPDGHTDRSLSLGATYYFKAPWIVEAGVRFNASSPGAIRSNQQFVAATYGRVGSDVVTVRHGWGAEAYQAIASSVTLVNFDSRQTSVAWRHWFNPQTGVLLSAEQYTNPFYQRKGITVGLFHRF